MHRAYLLATLHCQHYCKKANIGCDLCASLRHVFPAFSSIQSALPLVYPLTHRVPLMCVSVQYVAELLHEQGQPIVSTCSAADVQAAFNTIVTRIQRL